MTQNMKPTLNLDDVMPLSNVQNSWDWTSGQALIVEIREPFLERPETFRANFGWHNFLCILKRRRLEARNFAVNFIFIPFTTYEKTSFTEQAGRSFGPQQGGPQRLGRFLNHLTKSDVTSGWKLSWTLVSLDTKDDGSTSNIFSYILNWQPPKLYTMTI